MSGRRWLGLTIATILAVAAANLAIAFAVDPYGVWRNPAGRKLPVAVITTGRKAKFLLSERYVPMNYDGLIIGASNLATWDIPTLAGAQIYNLSLEGGDSTEEKIVLDQALHRGHFKLAVFVLSTAMTASHDVKGGLDATTTAESLASFHLYIQEAAYAVRAVHHGAGLIDIAANGHYNYRPMHKNLDLNGTPTPFQIDPVALTNYRAMVQALKDQGATIVYVAPPLYEPFYRLHQAESEAYLKTMLSLLPSAPLIDFQASEYAALCSDPNNFADTAHLEPAGVEKFTALLTELVPRAINAEK
jgi:hypothetical protein